MILDFLSRLGLPLFLLPLKTIVLQTLLLFVTIAIEAQVIQNKLGLSPRGSVQFSTLLNLLSTVTGWFLFLGIEGFLPESSRIELINYVFFNDTSRLSLEQIAFLVIPLWLMLYVLTFILESQMLNLLLFLLASKPKLQYETTQVQYDRQQRYKASWTDRFRMNTLLIANAYSYTAVILLVFVTQVLNR